MTHWLWTNCQATGTEPGIGDWAWGWELGMGKWEIESTPSPRR